MIEKKGENIINKENSNLYAFCIIITIVIVIISDKKRNLHFSRLFSIHPTFIAAPFVALSDSSGLFAFSSRHLCVVIRRDGCPRRANIAIECQVTKKSWKQIARSNYLRPLFTRLQLDMKFTSSIDFAN